MIKIIDLIAGTTKRILTLRGRRCNGSVTYRSEPLAGALQEKMSGAYEFYFRCSDCDHNSLLCWIEFNYEARGIRKVGQSIAWSIEVPKELERDLGEDAKLYKKALVLLSQSYGIGACAYLRRNQINPLLAILLEMKQREGAAADDLEDITEAIKRKDFTSKIETAAAILPDSITVEGHNPVKLIHDQLSINIHSLSDDEVMPIALRLKTAVEYAVVELNRQKNRSRSSSTISCGVFERPFSHYQNQDPEED